MTNPRLEQMPFAGRASEIARLRERLAETQAGNGGTVMLTGEPGIGKTRLAEMFSDAARQEGWTVLRGSCYEGDSGLPYSPFAEALSGFARRADATELPRYLGYGAASIARIAPVLREILPDISEPPAIQPDEERFRLLDAVVQFLIAASKHAPVLLVLDDLHWADSGTIAMLRHVARFAPNNRLLLMGTYRDAEVDDAHPLSSALEQLERQSSFERLHLAGLRAEDVGTMITALAGYEAPTDVVDLITSETSGNPFFVGQVMLHLIESDLLVCECGNWTLTPESITAAGIPDGVSRLIRRRLSRLSEQANRLLVAACAFSGAFMLGVAAVVAGLSDSEAVNAADETLAAQLVTSESEDDRYGFAHALVRHTIYGALSPSRRVRLHRTIAEALEQTDDPMKHVSELAYQYARSASLPGAERGARYAIAAADQAETAYAYGEMAGFLGIALTLLPLDDTARPRLTARRSLALAWARDYKESARVAKEAARQIASSEGNDAAADFLADATRDVVWGGTTRPPGASPN